MSEEPTLPLAKSPGVVLLEPLPLAMVEDHLSEKRKEIVKFVANNPYAQTGWIADQMGVEVDEIMTLMAQPKAREYARSYMATVLQDEQTSADLLKMALTRMMQLAETRPQDYAEVDVDGNWQFSMDKLKKAPPGTVVQLDLSRGRPRPTFVDGERAREAVVEYHAQLVAGKRDGGAGVNVNVNILSDPKTREAMRASLMGELQAAPIEAEVANG